MYSAPLISSTSPPTSFVLCRTFWIEVYLVLAHESANAGHLCDARNSLELIAQIPVLQRAQIGQAFGVAAIDEGVLIDPACAGGIGANSGMHVSGQASCDLLQVFGYARACPIEVGVILKDDEDIRVAEHGLGANILDLRSGEQSGNDWVGNLVFNHIWRFAGPWCVNDHLHIADVGQRIQRDTLQAPEARDDQENCSRENQEGIACAPRDDA